MLAVREELEHRQGHREAQASDLQQLQVLAESLGDDEAICETLRRRIRLERLRGEREAEAAAIAALKARAAASGNSRWQAEALQAEGTYFVLLGQYDAARTSWTWPWFCADRCRISVGRLNAAASWPR